MRTMESGLCRKLFKQSRRRRWRICNLKSVFALFQTSVPLFQIGQFVKCRWIFLELSSKRHWGRLYERKWAAAYVRRKRNYFYDYGLHKTRTARINDSRLSSPLDRSNGDVVCFCTSHDFQQWLERSKLRSDWLRSGNRHILRYFFFFQIYISITITVWGCSAKLVRKPRRKFRQRSIGWSERDVPANGWGGV